MQKIPDTFCPAKWDELTINFSYNMVYACCKATPMHFVDDYNAVIEGQKINLLNGIKDPACNYCWNTEVEGKSSYRQTKYLKTFNVENFDLYKNNQAEVKHLEINIGNSCNLQCMYCNPKFSSKWEEDIRLKKYPVVTDRFNYEILKKNKGTLDQNINVLSKANRLETVTIIGGEPLINNKFFEILEYVKADKLSLCTNLSVDKEKIDRLLESTKNYKKIIIGCSIDSTNDLAPLLRYGIDLNLFYDNLNYLLSQKTKNIEIIIYSLMTNISILDIEKTSKLFTNIIHNNNNISWNISYCKNPRIFGFEALPDNRRDELIENFKQLTNNNKIIGPEVIISALQEIKFNKGIYKEFDYFIKEWQNRKSVQLPTYIKEKLYAETK